MMSQTLPARLPGTSCGALRGVGQLGPSRLPTLPVPRSCRRRLPRRGALPRAIYTPEPPVMPVDHAAKTLPIKAHPTQQSGQPASAYYGSPLVGKPLPLGATIDPSSGATNFALFSGSAWGVSLCLFREEDLQDGRVTEEILLDPVLNRTGDTWHIALPGLDSSLLYGYRMFGPHQEDPESPGSEGHRFSEDRVVLDPYAKAIISRRHYGEMGRDLPYGAPGVLGHAATWPQMAAALPQPPGRSSFDWEGDRPLNLPMEDLVVYEMHVRGFTRDPSSGVSAPGTYKGMIEKLDYLQRLGVNAIEMMPIHEFNELEYYTLIPGTGAYRYNMWGYSTVGFFAPMSRYSAAAAAGGNGEDVLNEFKQLVKECHKRGMEVILDVVYNHTAEGNEQGPTLSFRGLDNRVYYMLAPAGQYYNYSGCGNTLNCNHPVVRQFILDSLKYWVTEMHVDGFRFDLGSILTRAHSQWHKTQPVPPGAAPNGEAPGDGAISVAPLSGGAIVDENGLMTDGAGVPTGTPLTDPPLIEMISEDPVLRNTKLIAEAWDCDGLNQVGAFPHYGRWSEWNGHFRDTVRQFVKGTDGPWTSNLASVLCGSPHIYLHEPGEQDWWGNHGGRRWKGGRGPTASVNFVVAHDGFTLGDLVAYNEKHNEANGENNRDGESHNLSWNCGAEGPTDQAGVLGLRQRQMRNFFAALLLGHGVPMFYMGDEYGHSKGGNNNTYCHDSELNWMDWDAAERDEKGLVRFVRHMIALRKSTPELRRTGYVGGEMQWHGVVPHKPDWTEANRFLAFTLSTVSGEGGLYVAFNASHLPQLVQLPEWGGRVWQPVVDSGKVAPYDVLRADERLSEEQVAEARGAAAMWTLAHQYPMLPWSIVVLESVPTDIAAGTVARGSAAAGERQAAPAPPAYYYGSVAEAKPAAAAASWAGAAGMSHAAAEAPAAPAAAKQQQVEAAEEQPQHFEAAGGGDPHEVLSAAKELASMIAGSAAQAAAAAVEHTSALLPSDAERGWRGGGAAADLAAQMTEEERAAYEALMAENERLRGQLGLA